MVNRKFRGKLVFAQLYCWCCWLLFGWTRKKTISVSLRRNFMVFRRFVFFLFIFISLHSLNKECELFLSLYSYLTVTQKQSLSSLRFWLSWNEFLFFCSKSAKKKKSHSFEIKIFCFCFHAQIYSNIHNFGVDNYGYKRNTN